MLVLSPGALLALAFLAGGEEAAEPPSVPTCAATPRVDLAADSTGQASEVCVTPGEPTTFVFEAPLPPEAVVVSDSRSVGLAQGDDFVTVYPKQSFLTGERVKLMVRFGDGAAPESASFWLVGHAARGARRVDVFRQPRQADAFKREAAEAQAIARQCQEDNARLLAEREEPGGLMGTAWLERNNRVSWKDLGPHLKSHPTSTLRAGEAASYTHQGGTRPKGEASPASVAVRVRLTNPGTEPWKAAGALLVSSTGEAVELTAWQDSAIPPRGTGHVVVGTNRELGQLTCPCIIKLWDAPGARVVTLGNITFPYGPKAGH